MSDDTRPPLIIASHNSGKIREFQAVLGHRWQVCPQSDLNVGDVEETGSTFVENALIKARHACAWTRCAALADDSGLVVPALGGAPGLRSARYSGGDDEANNALLLKNMATLEAEARLNTSKDLQTLNQTATEAMTSMTHDNHDCLMTR